MPIEKTQLEKVFNKTSSFAGYLIGYTQYLNDAIVSLEKDCITNVVNTFVKAWESKRTIFFAGNGGSAATASHFAQDLAAVSRKAGIKPFRVLSLTDNTSYITASGNDYGFEKIFTTQMEGLFEPGDVLVALSASGNSPNVVKAVEYANKCKGTSVALVGFDGGILAKIAHQVIIVKSNKGEYGPVEDVHMILDHVITSYLVFSLTSRNE